MPARGCEFRRHEWRDKALRIAYIRIADLALIGELRWSLGAGRSLGKVCWPKKIGCEKKAYLFSLE